MYMYFDRMVLISYPSVRVTMWHCEEENLVCFFHIDF